MLGSGEAGAQRVQGKRRERWGAMVTVLMCVSREISKVETRGGNEEIGFDVMSASVSCPPYSRPFRPVLEPSSPRCAAVLEPPAPRTAVSRNVAPLVYVQVKVTGSAHHSG